MFQSVIAVTLIAVMPALLVAQTPPPASKTPTPTAKAEVDPSATRVPAESDGILAAWLTVENLNEVAVARFAVDRAKAPEVKKFAQTMITEHGQFATKLQPFLAVAAPGGRGVGKPLDVSGTARPPASTGGAFDHTALIQDLGKKCLESATAALADKRGEEFDRCYMAMQVAAHVRMADMLEVFERHSSDNLRPTLVAGLKTVQDHLTHAKNLCEQSAKGDKGEKAGNDDRR